jgi:hypothetical protein
MKKNVNEFDVCPVCGSEHYLCGENGEPRCYDCNPLFTCEIHGKHSDLGCLDCLPEN